MRGMTVVDQGKTMGVLILTMLMGVALSGSVWAEEPVAANPKVVGYLLGISPTPEKEADDPEFEAQARVIRGDKELEGEDGFPLLEGDIVVTGASSTAAVAFVDESAVTLYDQSRLRIREYAYPALRQSTLVELEQGGAYFDIQKRPVDARFTIQSPAGRVEVKGTVFEILLTFAAGQWAAEVLVRSGVVNVSGTDITSDGQTLSLVNLAGGVAAPVNLSSINVFERFARRRRATMVALVTTDTSGNVTIKGSGTGPDGEIRTFLIKENVTKGTYSEKSTFKNPGVEKGTFSNTKKVNKKTGVISYVIKDTRTGIEGKESISETRNVLPDGTTQGGGTYKRAITDSSGSTLTFKGTFTLSASGDPVEITGTVSGSSGGSVTGAFRIVRDVAGDGTLTELLFMPATRGNLPAVQRTVRKPDGSVEITFLDGSNPVTGGNVVSGPFTTIGFGATSPGILTPGNTLIRPGEEPRTSP